MKYLEAKVLAPVHPKNVAFPSDENDRADFEGRLVDRYGGFHVGPQVLGRTSEWGDEAMAPYYVAATFQDGYTREAAAYELGERLADLVKEVYGEEAVYVAITELAGPFIR